MSSNFEERNPTFNDARSPSWAFALARAVIPANGDSPFFLTAAQQILAAVIVGLEVSSTHRIGMADLIQAVRSYDSIIRSLQATAKGQEIYERYFRGPSTVLLSTLSVMEDSVLGLLDRRLDSRSLTRLGQPREK
jgi:hypothetical protein